MANQFKPTRSEIVQVKDLAKWCEEAAGTGQTIAGEPSSQLWSRCAFALAAEVAARSVGGAA